jgi:predicted nucleotidyltransferase
MLDSPFSKPKSLLTLPGLSEEIKAMMGRPVALLTEAALTPHIGEKTVRDPGVI